jgi:hypothetical protein
LKTKPGLFSLGFSITNYPSPITNLFHLFMRRVLAAPTAELLQLQPVRCRFAVLGRRIIPLFAIAALQRNNFSGHFNSSWLLALSF